MKTEELMNELERIVTFCKDNTIFPFYGKILNNSSIYKLAPLPASCDNLENYLEAILHFEPKTVFIETYINDWIPNERQTKKYIDDYEKKDNQEGIASFNKYVKKISMYEGQVYRFKIFFLHENFEYGYYRDTDWGVYVDVLEEAREELEFMDEDSDD